MIAESKKPRPGYLGGRRDAAREETISSASDANCTASPRIVGVSEVASYLHVSEKTARSWCRSGAIPAFKPSGSNRWFISERILTELIEGGAL